MVETTGAPLQCGATSRRPGESTEDMYAMVKTWYMHVVYMHCNITGIMA